MKCLSSPQACTGSEKKFHPLAYEMRDIWCCGSFQPVPFGTLLVGQGTRGLKHLEPGNTRTITFIVGGKAIHSRMISLTNMTDNRPYTTTFTISPDGQAVVSIGATPQHYARLNPQQLGPLFTLNERTVPTRWQDFQILMWKMEKRMGSSAAPGQPGVWLPR